MECGPRDTLVLVREELSAFPAENRGAVVLNTSSSRPQLPGFTWKTSFLCKDCVSLERSGHSPEWTFWCPGRAGGWQPRHMQLWKQMALADVAGPMLSGPAEKRGGGGD